MKKINLYFIAVLAALTALGACKKLNLYPYNQIEVSQSFKTVKDAQAWDTGILQQFRSVQTSTFGPYIEVAADQLNAALDYGNLNGPPHNWDGLNNTDAGLRALWSNYYTGIANANVAIKGYASIPVVSGADQAQINQYYGDAYLARAYFYHCLILRWAKPYETATAASDLGVPLVLTYDISALPARATVQAVYTQILADIAKAQTLLANTNTGATAASRAIFTIDAAKALEARVKLCMHDNAGAYAAANSLIVGAKYPLINTQAALTAYWTNDTFSESIMQLAINTSELPGNQSIFLKYIPAIAKYDPPYVPSQWVVDMYVTADIRKDAYFKQLPVNIQGIDYANVWCVTKYPGNPALFTSSFSNYANAIKTFRIAEMYCIAAEAASATGNDVNALLAINALRTARGEAALTSAGTTLVSDIRDERTRELAFEGTRLNDLTRWHLALTRHDPQNVNMLVQGSNYYTLSVPANAPKFQWGLPGSDVSINPNLIQNPGW